MTIVHTYRQWNSDKSKSWIFYVESYDKEDNDYFCEHLRYEDGWYFSEEYILQNSKQISKLKFLFYKYFK